MNANNYAEKKLKLASPTETETFIVEESLVGVATDNNFTASSCNLQVYNPLTGNYTNLLDKEGIPIMFTLDAGVYRMLDFTGVSRVKKIKITFSAAQSNTELLIIEARI